MTVVVRPNHPISDFEHVLTFPDNLPYEDGVPMESFWMFLQIGLLTDVLRTNWKGRRFYCGGNMFLYFSAAQARDHDYLGPDFFVALDVDPDRERDYWAIWEEDGRAPNFILELLSPTTAVNDRTIKKEIYETRVRAREYVIYDRDTKQLEGWRLGASYHPIKLEAGRIWCESLQLWLGGWRGVWQDTDSTWIRFFDREGNMLPTATETAAARAQAEAARAEAETTRAEKAESELARLKQELEALRQQGKPSTP